MRSRSTELIRQAALRGLRLGRRDWSPADLPEALGAALERAAAPAPLLAHGAGGGHLLRLAAIRWALDHPGAQLLLTGVDDLTLRRQHLEGSTGIPALVRELEADGRIRALTPHEVRFAGGSRLRWAAIPGSWDLSRVVVSRVDGVLLDHLDQVPADVARRLVEMVAGSTHRPRVALAATPAAPEPWMVELWPEVVDLPGGDGPAPAVLRATPAEDLPPYPDGPDPGSRDARDAELLDLHRQRAAWFSRQEEGAEEGGPPLPAMPASRWRALLAEERLRRQWEAWRLYHRDDGTARDAEDAAEQLSLERQRGAESFDYFAERWGVLQEPRRPAGAAGGDIPLIPWPAQRELAAYLLAAYREGRDAIVLKSRDVGATWKDSVLDLWLWLTVPGYQSLCGTYEWELVDDDTTDSLFGKLRYLLAHLPAWLRPDVEPVRGDKTAHLAHPETGATIVGRRPKKDFGRGRRRSRVRLDEAPKWARRIQAALRTSLSSTSDCCVRLGTPDSPGDDFHRRVKLADAGSGTVFRVPWWADPRATMEWYLGLVPREMTWEEREREHNLGFVSVSGHRIFRVGSVAGAGMTYVTTDDPPEDRPTGARVLDAARMRLLPTCAMMDFGSGPSDTVLSNCWYEWEELHTDEAGQPVFDPDPIIYMDLCVAWNRTPAADIAAEGKGLLAEPRYGHLQHVGGDPAGAAKDSRGSSWFGELRAGGLDIGAMPGWANTQYEIQQSLETWQRLMDRGRVFYHATRARLLIRSVEGWTWNIPEGVNHEDLSRDVIMPRKDGLSHAGDTGRYIILWITRLARQSMPLDDEQVRELAQLGPAGAGDPGEVLDDILGGRGMGGGPSFGGGALDGFFD